MDAAGVYLVIPVANCVLLVTQSSCQLRNVDFKDQNVLQVAGSWQ